MKSSIFCSYLANFPAQAQKTKKVYPEKNSLYFRKWNFLALILKKIVYFLKRKPFLYFQKWNTAHFTPSSKNKRNAPDKISYISGNGNLEAKALEKLLIFQGVTCKARKTNKNVCFEEIYCLL